MSGDNESTAGEVGLGSMMADLKTELEAQSKLGKSETGKPQMQMSDGVTDFALSLFFGLVISAVAIAYLRYARHAARPAMAVTGLALLVIPFVVSGAWKMAAAATVVALIPLGLKRVGIL